MSVARRRFRFIKEIAEGGFGKVYLAEQISADGFSRIVAVKLLHAKWSSHDEIVMRTRDEARLLGLIRHQNIVRVEDLTSIEGKCAIVMEYLEGVDLKSMMGFLRERDIEFPRAALFEIFAIVASALDAAYNGRPLQGGEPLKVIHRDIKPSNIFVTIPGSVKVLDFGTARANFAEREAKTQALAFGSQGYMAPERLLGEEDTAAADVFSLGITLYELLCLEGFGRIPPRPEKFAAKIEERVAQIPLGGDFEWQEQIRETLRLMLSYAPKERPTAAQLVDIFELLAGRAQDMPLRRFCRTIVEEAKNAEPPLDTGDPLNGRTVDEDVSSAFGMGHAGVVEPVEPSAHPPHPPPPPPGLGSATVRPKVGVKPSIPPAPAPPPPKGSTPTPAASVAPAPPKPAAPAPPAPAPAPTPRQSTLYPDEDLVAPRRSGAMKFAVAGFAGFAALGVVVVVVLGVVLALWRPWAGGPAPTPVPSPAPAPAPDPPTGPPPTVGCSVSSPDGRDGLPTVPTTLVTTGVSEVVISGGVGFRANWSGAGTCELALPVGSYRTNVTPDGGSTLRSKTFQVAEGAACHFTFDLTAREWTGGCG